MLGPVLRWGWVSEFHTNSSGASVCVTKSSGEASNSRILFTSPGWMMDLTRLTKDERSSSLKVRCSAAATLRLTTSTLATVRVFGKLGELPSVCSER